LSKSIGLAALSRPWKMIAATRNMDYPMIKIELTRHHLKIEDKSIPVERIGDVKTNLWTERAQIVDVDGNVVFKTHATAIISSNVLYDLLARLQEGCLLHADEHA
jgi:hypothetical protein